MKRMGIASVAAAAAASLLWCAAAVGAESSAGGWKSLFDGKTLKGWHLVGELPWVVEDGAIVGRITQKSKLYSLLVSDKVYGDFTIRFKFKSLKGNSGFYVRTLIEEPDRAHGLQIEVDPRKDSGGIYESYGRAWVVQPDPAAYAKFFKPDDWNEMTITACGHDVEVKVNGVTSAQVKDDPSRPTGHFAMQMHAGNEMLVMFKDIEIQVPPKKKGPVEKTSTKPRKILPEKRGSLVLPAVAARTVGSSLAYIPSIAALGWWTCDNHAEWDLQTTRPATYDVYLEWAVNDKNAGNAYTVEAAGQCIEGKIASTGAWDKYGYTKIGQIQIPAGQHTLAFKPKGQFKTELCDFRELRLVPARKK